MFNMQICSPGLAAAQSSPQFLLCLWGPLYTGHWRYLKGKDGNKWFNRVWDANQQEVGWGVIGFKTRPGRHSEANKYIRQTTSYENIECYKKRIYVKRRIAGMWKQGGKMPICKKKRMNKQQPTPNWKISKKLLKHNPVSVKQLVMTRAGLQANKRKTVNTARPGIMERSTCLRGWHHALLGFLPLFQK